MPALWTQFSRDEAGFIVSAELVLVTTIAVLALVVGLSQVSTAINNELNDVAQAFGSLNQSYCFNGQRGCKGSISGSCYRDQSDQGDNLAISCNNPPTSEGDHGYGW